VNTYSVVGLLNTLRIQQRTDKSLVPPVPVGKPRNTMKIHYKIILNNNNKCRESEEEVLVVGWGEILDIFY
jgi:hypothetical protein